MTRTTRRLAASVLATAALAPVVGAGSAAALPIPDTQLLFPQCDSNPVAGGLAQRCSADLLNLTLSPQTYTVTTTFFEDGVRVSRNEGQVTVGRLGLSSLGPFGLQTRSGKQHGGAFMIQVHTDDTHGFKQIVHFTVCNPAVLGCAIPFPAT